jgi:hypothetical protein
MAGASQCKILVQSDPLIMRHERNQIRMAAMVNDLMVVDRASLAQIQDHKFDTNAYLDHVPVGSVEFCQAFMGRLGIEIPLRDAPSTYPNSLLHYLGRPVSARLYRDVPDGQFCKPVRTKIFTGHIKGQEWPFGETVPSDLDHVAVYASPPVNFISEMRCYVIDEQIIDIVPYVEDEGAARPSHQVDMTIVQNAVRSFERENAIRGYGIDFGVLDDGRTVVVEWNDGWALGHYRSDKMSIDRYIELCAARWEQILSLRFDQQPKEDLINAG